jgi:hypothetical protein
MGVYIYTVHKGIHGGVDKILHHVVASRVPVRFGSLVSAELFESSP